MILAQSAQACGGDQLSSAIGNLVRGQAVGIANHRSHQSLGGIDGGGDVDGFVTVDALAIPTGVEFGELAEGQGRLVDQDVVVAGDQPVCCRDFEAFAKGNQRLGVDLRGQCDGNRLMESRRHALGDGPAKS